ncbi:MAG: hypothetical protein AB1651_18490 [Pseudomonadota bacterium]
MIVVRMGGACKKLMLHITSYGADCDASLRLREKSVAHGVSRIASWTVADTRGRAAFERRQTPIPERPPIALTREYWDNPSRPTQLRAFARRARIAVPENFAADRALKLARRSSTSHPCVTQITE